MKDEYAVDVPQNNEFKQTLFGIMTNVKNTSPQDTPLKTLNNVVLNELRDSVLKRNMGNNKKPRVRNLERDQQIFGDRRVELGEQLMFEMNPPKRDDNKAKQQIDVLISDRKTLFETQPPPPPFKTQRVPDAPSADEIIQKMESLERMREADELPTENKRMMTMVDLQKTQPTLPDPKSLYTLNEPRNNNTPDDIIKLEPYKNHSEDVIIKQSERYSKSTFVLINGYDRRWLEYPHRYSFSFDTNSNNAIRNITEIAFTRLILPLETLATKKSTSSNDGNRFYNQYGLTFPYLMLQVDELSPGLYQGFNKSSQKCFTTFVYHREYRASNGRGFVIMQPLQNEKKEYRGSPLSILPRLTMSIVKPNGTLYNMAKDENKITELLYESMNPLLIRVICKDYFDTNEFAVGDVVLVKNFKLPSAQEFVNAVTTSGGSVSPSELSTYAYGINAIEEFINRDEGHEIISTGDPNTNMFMNTFSIYLPRILDKHQGIMVIQKDFFDTVNVCQSFLNRVPNFSTGNFINTTLQIVLTMKIQTLDSDIGLII